MNGIPGDVLMEAYRVLLQTAHDGEIKSEKAVQAWEAAEAIRPHLERLGLLHAARAA